MESKGKLIYHTEERSLHAEGDKFDLIEKEVKYSEDRGLYCKMYQKKDGKITKYEVISPKAGGQYTLNVTVDGEKKTSTHTKTELLAFLKKNSDLKFMAEYIGKSTSLSRALARSKSKSRTRSRSRSKKTARKTK